MKSSVKNLDKCRVQLSVAIDAEEAAKVVKDVEKVFMREARLPGFRPGKVPLELIRREFAEGLKDETSRAMFRKYYGEAVRAEGVEEVALADVQDMKCGPDGGSFAAVVEVKPKFKLPAYKGLKISRQDASVSEEEVSKFVEEMRAMYAKYEDAKEGDAVSDGDFVQIDYSGTVGGKPILEIAPDAKVVASGEGFWTQVAEGRFLKEILDALKGMKAGESKSGVKAKFDKEAAPDPLKGKTAEYSVTLKAFRRRVMPTDAELVERVKAESMEKFLADTREHMEKSALEREAARREDEAVEQLLKKATFDVPQSQVRHAMDGYLDTLAKRAQYAGMTAEYLQQNRDKILKDAEAAATRQVRLWYVVEAIAAEEKIEAKDEERGKKVIEFVLANAK